MYFEDEQTQTGSNSAVPDELTSDNYTVDTYISRVAADTTVGAFRQAFDQDVASIVVYAVSGEAAADSDLMKTGMTVSLVANGQTVKQYQTAVAGDLRGTGTVSSSSVRELLCMVTGASGFAPVTALAADYDGNGSVATTDARKMLGLLTAG